MGKHKLYGFVIVNTLNKPQKGLVDSGSQHKNLYQLQDSSKINSINQYMYMYIGVGSGAAGAALAAPIIFSSCRFGAAVFFDTSVVCFITQT